MVIKTTVMYFRIYDKTKTLRSQISGDQTQFFFEIFNKNYYSTEPIKYLSDKFKINKKENQKLSVRLSKIETYRT